MVNLLSNLQVCQDGNTPVVVIYTGDKNQSWQLLISYQMCSKGNTQQEQQ